MDGIVSHADVQGMLGAYAVHALDPDEIDRIENHVASCDSCTVEVERLFEAAAAFGMAQVVTPTTDLWERIAAEVRLKPRDQFDASALSAADPRVIQRVVQLDNERDSRRGAQDRLRSNEENSSIPTMNPRPVRWSWKVVLGSAAAAIAVVVPITTIIARSSVPSTSIAALATAASKQAGSTTTALLDSAKARVGDVVITKSGQGYVRVTQLAGLGNDQTYQLWTLDNGKPISAGLLGSEPTVVAFGARGDVDAFAISVEPRTGSVAPTATPIAIGSVASK
jgi:anti-sigma-K factor RskA